MALFRPSSSCSSLTLRPATATGLSLADKSLRLAGSSSVRVFNKDHVEAVDFDKRSTRFASLQEKRRGHLMQDLEVDVGPPLVRGPPSGPAGRQPQESDWHKTQVESFFKTLDTKGHGEVSLAQLKHSFAMMKMRIDSATFLQYTQQLLAPGADSVSHSGFLAFHKAVWANQPAAVRRYAGDPEVATQSQTKFNELTVTSTKPGKRRSLLRKSPSVHLPGPKTGLFREVRTNEEQLRDTFYRYTSGDLYMRRRTMPDVLRDLGINIPEPGSIPTMEAEVYSEYVDHQFHIADEDADGKVSFHEFADYQNRCISMKEAMSGFRERFRESADAMAAEQAPLDA